jgi:hypothetical protein
MTRRQWVVSAFIVWHLGAVIAAVIPTTGQIQPPRAVALERSNWVESRVAPSFDAIARSTYTLIAVARSAVWPLRRVTTPYLNGLGFDEHWPMFSTPPKTDQYVRIRYFIRRPDGTNRTATELVFPASPEDSVRAFESFRGSYQDRAVNTMLEQFHADERNRPSSAGLAVVSESPYLPLANYFSSRYARAHLSKVERIPRVEVWHGLAPNSPPGTAQITPQARLNLLQDYHTGLIDSLGAADPAALSGTEREADIAWTMEFVQTR